MTDPGHGAQVARGGPPLEEADAAVILLHGRGAPPGDMLGLARMLDLDRIAWLAPAATGGTWYPASFLAPGPENAAGVASAHAANGWWPRRSGPACRRGASVWAASRRARAWPRPTPPVTRGATAR